MKGTIWKTVGIVNDENMMQPHALQQKKIPEQTPAKDPSDREIVPCDEHRLVPVSELKGVK